MEDGKFTVYAGKSVALAEVFKYTVGKELILGPVICRLELSAPTEESTDGGRLAMQHMSIVPEGGGPTVVIGTAYQLDRLAANRELRNRDPRPARAGRFAVLSIGLMRRSLAGRWCPAFLAQRLVHQRCQPLGGGLHRFLSHRIQSPPALGPLQAAFGHQLIDHQAGGWLAGILLGAACRAPQVAAVHRNCGVQLGERAIPSAAG